MHSQKIIIFLSISTRIVLAGDCGAFSVGECSPSQEDVIEVQHLPCEGIDTHECVRLCQRLCSITADCNFFSYNSELMDCILIQESSENAFLSTCDVLAGPDTPTLQQCAGTTPEDDCDRFVAQDCEYLGTDVFNKTDVHSPSECQTLLADFGSIYKATLFVHDASPRNLCFLKDTDRRTCTSLAGPPEPDYDECVSRAAVRNIY